jgi:2,5-diketo-D-gluconate reductase A
MKYNITVNSYSPGAAPDHTAWLDPSWNPIPDLRKHPNVTQIAAKHGKSPSQVMFRWHWQQGIVINPRTRNTTHMMENLSIFDFELDTEDMMILSYLIHPKFSKVGDDRRLVL